MNCTCAKDDSNRGHCYSLSNEFHCNNLKVLNLNIGIGSWSFLSSTGVFLATFLTGFDPGHSFRSCKRRNKKSQASTTMTDNAKSKGFRKDLRISVDFTEEQQPEKNQKIQSHGRFLTHSSSKSVPSSPTNSFQQKKQQEVLLTPKNDCSDFSEIVTDRIMRRLHPKFGKATSNIELSVNKEDIVSSPKEEKFKLALDLTSDLETMIFALGFQDKLEKVVLAKVDVMLTKMVAKDPKMKELKFKKFEIIAMAMDKEEYFMNLFQIVKKEFPANNPKFENYSFFEVQPILSNHFFICIDMWEYLYKRSKMQSPKMPKMRKKKLRC